MGDYLNRRSAAGSYGGRVREVGRPPKRSYLGDWLGGDEAARAEHAHQRVQEAFAEPLYTPPNTARFGGNQVADRPRAAAEMHTYADRKRRVAEALAKARLRSAEVDRRVREAQAAQAAGDQLRPTTPSVRERISDAIRAALEEAGVPRYTARHYGEGFTGLGETLSDVGGITLAADDFARTARDGSWGDVGLSGLALAASVLPFSRMGRQVAKEGRAGAKIGAEAGRSKWAGLKAGAKKAQKRKVAAEAKAGKWADYEPAAEKGDRYVKWEPTLFHEVEKLLEVPQHNLPRYVPARGVPARIHDLINDPIVRKQMLGFAEIGDAKGATKWHYSDPLRLEYWRELQKEAGERDFRLFANLLGATSSLSDVPTNIRLASYYNHLIKKYGAIPGDDVRNPPPYGHRLEARHKANVNRVLQGGLDSIRNPKPSSMAGNAIGNLLPVQVDSKMYRLPAILSGDPRGLKTTYHVGKEGLIINPRQMVDRGEMRIEEAQQYPNLWRSAPQRNEYGAFEGYIQNIAREYGLTPAEVEAAIWVGGADISGLRSDPNKPLLGFLEDRVMLTALDKGLDPKEVVRRSLIRGDFPLLALSSIGLGAATARGALGEYDDERQRRSARRGHDASRREPRT